MYLPPEVLFPVQIAGGFLAGFAVGYLAKHLFKLALVILGLSILIIFFLNYKGYISYEDVMVWLKGLEERLRAELLAIISVALANMPFTASFIIGILIGLAKG